MKKSGGGVGGGGGGQNSCTKIEIPKSTIALMSFLPVSEQGISPLPIKFVWSSSSSSVRNNSLVRGAVRILETDYVRFRHEGTEARRRR